MENTAHPKNHHAANVILVGLISVVVILLIVIVMFLSRQPGSTQQTNTSRTNNIATANTTSAVTPEKNENEPETPTESVVLWSYNSEKWQPMGNPPACADPLIIPSPNDIKLATAILYPGQTRGGDYKPHGGMRFDGKTNTDIQAALPANAALWRGSRYIESGEIQYLLDFVMPCGIMFRFDHLLTLAPEFAQIVEQQFPAAKPDDTRTTIVNSTKLYQAGTVIATTVGHTGNVGYDFGVYDLRSPNQISTNTSWANAHSNKRETSFYAVCWLDYLPAAEKQIAKSLPGGGTEGKSSDYCK